MLASADYSSVLIQTDILGRAHLFYCGAGQPGKLGTGRVILHLWFGGLFSQYPMNVLLGCWNLETEKAVGLLSYWTHTHTPKKEKKRKRGIGLDGSVSPVSLALKHLQWI